MHGSVCKPSAMTWSPKEATYPELRRLAAGGENCARLNLASRSSTPASALSAAGLCGSACLSAVPAAHTPHITPVQRHSSAWANSAFAQGIRHSAYQVCFFAHLHPYTPKTSALMWGVCIQGMLWCLPGTAGMSGLKTVLVFFRKAEGSDARGAVAGVPAWRPPTLRP